MNEETPADAIIVDSNRKVIISPTVDYAELRKFLPPQLTETWGLHIAIDAHDCDPDLIRDGEAIKEFTVRLCELIEMKRFRECMVVNFGEDERVAGYSMFQFIETSCVSGHFANQTNRVYLDVFSCKKYDLVDVIQFTSEFFKAKGSITAHVLERD